LSKNALLSISSDKNIIPPFGVFGGGPGHTNQFVVLREEQALMPSDTPGKVAGFPLEWGDCVVMETSGGGGFGDPLEREPVLVEADVREGYVSPEEARVEYGVHLVGGKVDKEKTHICRQDLKSSRLRLPLIQVGILRDRGSRRLCSMNPNTANDLGLEAGALVELKGNLCAPLRAWIEVVQNHPEGQLGLDALGMAILQEGTGGSVVIRPLFVGAFG
jgi:N-methylhydantoinase B